MPLILSGNVASATADAGYTVANSCRFNNGYNGGLDDAYLGMTPSGASNRRTFTVSAWVKRGSHFNDEHPIFSAGEGSGFSIRFSSESGSNSAINVYEYVSGWQLRVHTSAVYRDPSAWMHVCVAIDTTQATDTNRVKIYVNGTQVTALGNADYPSENYDTLVNSGILHTIARNGTAGDYYDGYLAEVCMIDGSALTPTSFGEFDSDSPTIWKPIDVSGLTFGTNGFYLDFEASDNLGNDANGGTDWTETNLAAEDQATDTPTNNFATLNPLYHPASNAPTLSEGNCKVVSSSALFLGGIGSTIGVASGKWYVEVKVTTRNTGAQIGVTSDPSVDVTDNAEGRAIGFLATSFGYQEDGQEVTNDTRGAYGASYDTDIVGIALDCDNNKIYYSKNGGWSDGDGTSDAATPNDFQTITAPASTPTGFYFFGASDGSTSATNTYEFNFGNPTFSITSGNADANGYGNFEYAVPSGYFALNTKNLAEYG